MLYYREISLKDQRKCLLKNAERADAAAFLHYFTQAHAETDFLTTYADEGTHSVEDMEERLAAQKASRTEIEICAFVDGILVGSAGSHALSTREKLRHRADFGISILREYWGQGIGAALTGACIDCAKEAGFRQLELEVVGDNENAVRLKEVWVYGIWKKSAGLSDSRRQMAGTRADAVGVGRCECAEK